MGPLQGPISRRAFLHGLGIAGGAGAVLAAMEILDLVAPAAEYKVPFDPPRTDDFSLRGRANDTTVLVLGAGIAGLDGAVVTGKVSELKGNKGFNAATGEYEDLAAAGILDPTKVVRTALQNAASIAGLLLTTDAAVTDAPEPKKAAPSMPGGGEDYDY